MGRGLGSSWPDGGLALGFCPAVSRATSGMCGESGGSRTTHVWPRAGTVNLAAATAKWLQQKNSSFRKDRWRLSPNPGKSLKLSKP